MKSLVIVALLASTFAFAAEEKKAPAVVAPAVKVEAAPVAPKAPAKKAVKKAVKKEAKKEVKPVVAPVAPVVAAPVKAEVKK